MKRALFVAFWAGMTQLTARADTCELARSERAQLTECAWHIVSPLAGLIGTFDVHFDVLPNGRVRYRIDFDERGAETADDACRAALRAHPSCKWLVTGPSPTWKVRRE